MSDANTTVENSSKRFSNITQRTDNGSTTFVTATFTPQQGDQGSFPCCRAEQFDLATERRSLLVINKVEIQGYGLLCKRMTRKCLYNCPDTLLFINPLR